MDTTFSDTAVFCANCGHQAGPGDRFCRECGSRQMREANIEPVSVDKKMRLRAAELLPCLKLPAGYMPLMSDGMPARGGMPDPREMHGPDYQPPVFRPMIKDLSIKHDKPVEISSAEIDVFNLRCSYLVPPFDDEEKMKWYPAGDYCFHLIRTSGGARCRIEFHSYSDNREEEFDADSFALTRMDRLLKERDVAQLDGYSVHSPGAANHMDLLVQYAGGERIAATGIPPRNNKYYNEEWFIDFFRSLSGAFGKNIFTDSFKEKEPAGRQAAVEQWKNAVNGSAGNSPGDAAAQGGSAAAGGFWQCGACGHLNSGPFCIECGTVRPKE